MNCLTAFKKIAGYPTIVEQAKPLVSWKFCEKISQFAYWRGVSGMAVASAATYCIQKLDPTIVPSKPSIVALFTNVTLISKCVIDGMASRFCRKYRWGSQIAKKLAYESSILIYLASLIANHTLKIGGPIGDIVLASLLINKTVELYCHNQTLSEVQRRALYERLPDFEGINEDIAELTLLNTRLTQTVEELNARLLLQNV